MADKIFNDAEFEFDDSSLDDELDSIDLDDFELSDDDLDDVDGLEEFDFDSEDDDKNKEDKIIDIDDINSGDIDMGITEYEIEQEILKEMQDSESLDADLDGAILKNDLLMKDTQSRDEREKTSFISDTGDIVVMDPNEKGDNFRLMYIDIENIAIVPRIRKNKNVEDLVRSIRSTGLLKPIIVSPTQTDGIYVLIDGFRRIVACAKAGIRKMPCIVNTRVNTPEIPILEALYNHSKDYSVQEIVDYIDYLEKQKGIMSASMIEYLLQMNSGDYTKLKDLLNDDDEDIISKLFDGTYTIEQAFKKLEQRRKKESAEEKDIRKAAKVYEDEGESGVENIAGSGEEADETALTDEELSKLAINASDIDDGLEDASLSEMVEEGKNTPGFEAHKQKVGDREHIDPVIRKTVMARDNFTCACCKRGGESFVDALDYHHILPVFLGGADTPENGVTLCLTDHRLVHLYSMGDLHLPAEKSDEELAALTEDERVLHKDELMRFKRIVKLGQVIRDGMALKGIKREQYKKEHPIGSVGRNKPGKIQETT